LELRLNELIARIDQLEQSKSTVLTRDERSMPALDESKIEANVQRLQEAIETCQNNVTVKLEKISEKILPLSEAVASLQTAQTAANEHREAQSTTWTSQIEELQQKLNNLTAHTEASANASASDRQESSTEGIDTDASNDTQSKLDELANRIENLESSLPQLCAAVESLNNSPLPGISEFNGIQSPSAIALVSVSAPPPPPPAPPVVKSSPVTRIIKVSRRMKSEDAAAPSPAAGGANEVDFMAELRSRLMRRSTGRN
jgi:hypothetical protein